MEASRYVKDMRLLVEYRHVSTKLPPGMYILPSIASLHSWDGVLFVRRGPYRGAILKFRIAVPPGYPEELPRVFFLSSVFHPRVAPSGELEVKPEAVDLSAESDAQRRRLLPLLRHVHSIFYRVDARHPAANPVAAAMYTDARQEFESEAARCAETSAAQAVRSDPAFSMPFTAPSKVTEKVRCRIVREEQKARQVWSGLHLPS